MGALAYQITGLTTLQMMNMRLNISYWNDEFFKDASFLLIYTSYQLKYNLAQHDKTITSGFVR